MIKKFINTIILLITSGVIFHRCTLIGALCALWVCAGAAEDKYVFGRLLTLDLYLFMFAFVVFYRLAFKKTLTPRKEPDFQAMAIYTLGDFAWAVLAMFCVTFFISSLFIGSSSSEYKQLQNQALMPNRILMKTSY